MTFKPGDRAAYKINGRLGTIIKSASVYNPCRVTFDDAPGWSEQIGECDLDPLPAKPEDVREELIRIMEEKLYALRSGKVIFGLNAAADAILAKYPNLKTPEGRR